ncbi:MAG: c-type cytochrome domain-containing protein, partial [Pirellulaceae bacterium]
YCLPCHGADPEHREGGLRLDHAESAMGAGDSGKTVIVPGKPEASEMIRRILSDQEDEVMPPPQTKTVLPDAAKQLLKQWIAEGAVYQPHWAYVPPRQSVPPTLPSSTETPGIALHPIDAFIRYR